MFLLSIKFNGKSRLPGIQDSMSLKKLDKVTISVPVRQMYNLEKSEQLFFSVGSYSCLLGLSEEAG